MSSSKPPADSQQIAICPTTGATAVLVPQGTTEVTWDDYLWYLEKRLKELEELAGPELAEWLPSKLALELSGDPSVKGRASDNWNSHWTKRALLRRGVRESDFPIQVQDHVIEPETLEDMDLQGWLEEMLEP